MPTDIRTFFGRAKAIRKKEEKKDTLSSSGSSSNKSTTKANKSPGSGKKRKTTEDVRRQEISAADFFGKTQQKQLHKSPPSSPSKRQKKPDPPDNSKKETIDLVDSDDGQDVVVQKGTKTQKTNDDLDYEPVVEVIQPPSKRASPRKSSPVKKASPIKKATPVKKSSPAPRRAKKTKPPARAPPLNPTKKATDFDFDSAVAECLAGYTFVVTGVMPDHSREDVMDWIKMLGGRVTGSVSSKTDYLVLMGETLEDGRPSTEGSKFKKASTLDNVQIVEGKEALYGLFQQYHESQGGSSSSKKETVAPATNPYAAKVASNPYAKAAKVTSNPYAKANPYATKPATSNNPYAKKIKPDVKSTADAPIAATSAPLLKEKSEMGGPTQLWVDRYKPHNSNDILGNQESVRKLKGWLVRWEERFNRSDAIGKAFSAPGGPWKAALLSGPPGIGKTTTATLVARESGREVVEYNASDVRSKKAMQEQLGDITGSRSIQFSANEKRMKRCIIMDEVDGMGAGDRSGVAELILMIKRSQVPIICICNDRQSQKLKSLIPYCMDLKYRRPTKQAIARRAVQVAATEGLSVELNAAEAISESCGNDVRQVLNCLQMWSTSNDNTGGRLSYMDMKKREQSVNKDEILRVGLFDAARSILEGRKGLVGVDAKTELSSFMKRNDAFFVDYSFTGLLVQENYLKVLQGHYNDAKRSNNTDNICNTLDRMADAAESMSDYAHVENELRTAQNWGVLPFVGALTVKTGFHAGGPNGGFLPGFPQFTSYLGKNSSKGKRLRLLSEMNHHMNYKISGGGTEMRLSYLPTLRSRFVSLLTDKRNESGVEEAIALMDEYGLDRDDILEKMDEFNMNSKDKGFSALDTKRKTAFTKSYNSGSHRSQALISEQGKVPTKKRKAASTSGDLMDPDAIDDDQSINEVENDDEEEDAAKVAAMFKKKGRKKAAAKTKAGAKKAKGRGGKKN